MKTRRRVPWAVRTLEPSAGVECSNAGFPHPQHSKHHFLRRVAKALEIEGASERADVVRAIKAHPNRWLARRFAPYRRPEATDG